MATKSVTGVFPSPSTPTPTPTPTHQGPKSKPKQTINSTQRVLRANDKTKFMLEPLLKALESLSMRDILDINKEHLIMHRTPSDDVPIADSVRDLIFEKLIGVHYSHSHNGRDISKAYMALQSQNRTESKLICSTKESKLELKESGPNDTSALSGHQELLLRECAIGKAEAVSASFRITLVDQLFTLGWLLPSDFDERLMKKCFDGHAGWLTMDEMLKVIVKHVPKQQWLNWNESSVFRYIVFSYLTREQMEYYLRHFDYEEHLSKNKDDAFSIFYSLAMCLSPLADSFIQKRLVDISYLDERPIEWDSYFRIDCRWNVQSDSFVPQRMLPIAVVDTSNKDSCSDRQLLDALNGWNSTNKDKTTPDQQDQQNQQDQQGQRNQRNQQDQQDQQESEISDFFRLARQIIHGRRSMNGLLFRILFDYRYEKGLATLQRLKEFIKVLLEIGVPTDWQLPRVEYTKRVCDWKKEYDKKKLQPPEKALDDKKTDPYNLYLVEDSAIIRFAPHERVTIHDLLHVYGWYPLLQDILPRHLLVGDAEKQKSEQRANVSILGNVQFDILAWKEHFRPSKENEAILSDMKVLLDETYAVMYCKDSKVIDKTVAKLRPIADRMVNSPEFAWSYTDCMHNVYHDLFGFQDRLFD